MTTVKRIGRALVMAVTWAVAWAPIAVAIGVLIIDPDNSMDEMWPAIGALPGFFAGALFGGLLVFAERRRPFIELALPHVAALGAVAGAIVGTIPFLIGTPAPGVSVASLAAGFISVVTVLGAISAIVSALFVRRSKNRALRVPHAMMG